MTHQFSSVLEVEAHLDATLMNLPLLEWSLDCALPYTLAYAEYMNYFWTLPSRAGPGAALNVPTSIKKSLDVIVPEIYRASTGPGALQLGQEAEDRLLADVGHGLEFSARYEVAAVAFPQMRQGKLKADMNGRTVRFDYPSVDLARASVLTRFIHNRAVEAAIGYAVSSGAPAHIELSWFSAGLPAGTDPTSISWPVERTTRQAHDSVKSLVLASTAESTIPGEVSCGSYTIGEAYQVWIELKTLTVLHGFLARHSLQAEQHENLASPKFPLLPLLLSFGLSELASIVSDHSEVPTRVANAVLADWVLKPDATHPDVIARPLCPLPSSTSLLCAPFMVDSANWEACFFRNLAVNDPGLYGATIIPHKMKPLAEQLSQGFRKHGYAVATNRDLLDGEGQLVGDVDVAILDTEDGRLDIVEVKWLIPPDSIRESMGSDRQIQGARKQVKRLSRTISSNMESAVRQLFGDNASSPSSQVHLGTSVVISRGDVGYSALLDDPLVFDFDSTMSVVSSENRRSLDHLWQAVKQAHEDIESEITGPFYSPTDLSGVRILMPSFTKQVTAPSDIDARSKLGRNEPCDCGSGAKFKKCCQLI